MKKQIILILNLSLIFLLLACTPKTEEPAAKNTPDPTTAPEVESTLLPSEAQLQTPTPSETTEPTATPIPINYYYNGEIAFCYNIALTEMMNDEFSFMASGNAEGSEGEATELSDKSAIVMYYKTTPETVSDEENGYVFDYDNIREMTKEDMVNYLFSDIVDGQVYQILSYDKANYESYIKYNMLISFTRGSGNDLCGEVTMFLLPNGTSHMVISTCTLEYYTQNGSLITGLTFMESKNN